MLSQRPGLRSAFHLYVVRIDFAGLGKSRGEVMAELSRRGVGTQVHYIPVHRQPFYRDRYQLRAADYPAAERYYAQALSLPLFPKMSDADVDRVIRQLRSVLTPR